MFIGTTMSSTGGNISKVDSEDNRMKRQITESISIRQHKGTVMNRDEGSFDLSHMWDNVLPPINGGGGGGQEDLDPTRGCHSPPGGRSVRRKIANAAFKTVNE